MTKYSRHWGACSSFWLMVMCSVSISGYDVCCAHPDAPGSTGAKRMAGEWSEHAKALTALADGQLQHPVHLFIRVIRREAQLVKTGRARGKVINSKPLTKAGKLIPHKSMHWAVKYLPCVCSWQRAVGRSSNNLERGTEGRKASGW